MSPTTSSRARPVRLLVGLLGPVIAFLVLLRTLANATEALAITEAIPTLWVLIYAIWRRRIEPGGMIAVAGFGIALLVTIASGGSSLPLELHRAVFPGAAGLACLISLAARRPLLSIAKAKLTQAHPEVIAETRAKLDTQGEHHALATLTAIIGTTLLADAAAQIILAFTLSTSTFGVVAHVVAWGIIATGLGACALYLRLVRARLRAQAESQPPTSEPPPPSGGAWTAPEQPLAAQHR